MIAKKQSGGNRWVIGMVLFILLSSPMTLWAALGENSVKEASGGDYILVDILVLLLYVFLALFFSFLCSIAEAVLLSVTPSYIQGLKTRHPKQAALLKRLKEENIDRSLAAILTLNTIAHTVGAIGSGAKATLLFGSAWFGVFSALVTLAILFFSEIIPKTLGAIYWHRLTKPTAYFVQFLISTLYPIIWISEGITKFLKRKQEPPPFHRDELLAMTKIGNRRGQIKGHEFHIIQNLLRSAKITAKAIMTPRTVVLSASQNMTVDEAIAQNLHTQFSRIPIYEKALDDSEAFVLKTDILLAKAQGRDNQKLKQLSRPLCEVFGETSLSHLFNLLLKQRQHIALVFDEHGLVRGLVTLEDVVETLMGVEIVDEADRVEDMQAYARRKWKKTIENDVFLKEVALLIS